MATRKEIEPYDGQKNLGHEPRVPAVLEQVTQCGYCHKRVSPDRASYRQHVMSCEGHPAYSLAQALKELISLRDAVESNEWLKDAAWDKRCSAAWIKAREALK